MGGNEESRRKYMAADPGEHTGPPSSGAAVKHAKDSDATRPPLWHKDNPGFWLAVCVALSAVFAVVYTALR